MPRNSRSPLLSTEALCAAVWLGLLVQVAHAQSEQSSSPLSFGSFTAGVGGTLTVSPTGARSSTGGVMLVNQGPGSAGRIMFTGTANASVAVTLPTDGSVLLSDGNGDTMALNGFTSSPSNAGLVFNGGGSLCVNLGATMVVGSQQASGAYSGTFTVTINYN